jgi:hypothetical protein
MPSSAETHTGTAFNPSPASPPLKPNPATAFRPMDPSRWRAPF